MDTPNDYGFLRLTVRRKTILGGISNGCYHSSGTAKNRDREKIGNTTYIVNGFYAPKGVTVSEKVVRLLDRETKSKSL